MANLPLPTRDVLRQLLAYDPLTGILTWLPRSQGEFMPKAKEVLRWNSRYAGAQALRHRTRKGHLRGALLNKYYLTHRVIWKWLYDEEPEQIDHIDHDPANNRLANLRACDGTTNMRNRPKNPLNKSGVTGVHWNRINRNWRAKIREGGRVINVGSFAQFEDAVAARKAAEVRYGYHKNHGI